MPSGNTADQSQPSSSQTRILSLDVLRGIAVLAALIVSIWVFGGFSDNQQKQLLLQHKGWNYRVFAAIELLLNGKMRALIALVFGAAMILFLTKNGKEGKSATVDVFIKRHLWLIIFGLVNAVLFLWPQDILFPLGIMGILFFPFVRLSPRNLFMAAILITFIYSAKNYWNYADDKTTYHKYLVVTGMQKKFEKDSIANSQKNIIHKKDTLTKLQKQDKTAWEGRLSGMKVDLKKDDPNIKAMRSNDYGKTWNYVLPGTQFREASWTYRTGIWDLASMIFFGMFLYKIGFFTNRFSRSRYLLIGLIGIVAGLLCGWYRLHFQQLALQGYEKYINHYALPHTFLFPLERAFMALAYTSFVLMFLAAEFLNGMWKAFAAVGKLSLTNYFLQTIICTIFFYGYGMGYYGRLMQWQLYLFAAEVIMVQIVFSIIWLKHFNYGPFEWLLRRISSGKWLKDTMRKPSATNPEISVL
ncbi:MAG: DUF418 domain-containing protein [Ginsengibacter sp.]